MSLIPSLSPAKTCGNIFIPQHIADAELPDAKRHSFNHVIGRPTRGWRTTWTKKENIHAISAVEEGRLVPAWYPSFTPDATEGTVSTGVSGDSRIRWQVLQDAKSVSWTAATIADGHDTLVLTYYRPYATYSFSLSITRDEQEIYSEVLELSSSAAGAEQTFQIPALQSGDVITFAHAQVEADDPHSIMLCSFWTYKKDGIVSSSSQHCAVLGPLTYVLTPSSVPESVQTMAPTGMTPLHFGGLHQGGTGNGVQTSVTETFWINNAAHTLTQGWQSGIEIRWNRTSTAWYDASNPDIGSFDENYFINGGPISFTQDFVASEPLDTESRQVMMMPLPYGKAIKILTNLFAINLTEYPDSSQPSLSPGVDHVKAIGIIPRTRVCMAATRWSDYLKKVFGWNTSANNYNKLYWELEDVTNEAFSCTVGWTLWLEESWDYAGLTAPLQLT